MENQLEIQETITPRRSVIVRSGQSGCWCGTLVSLNGDTVELADAVRLWRWWAAVGVSLSGVAAAGLRRDKISDCKIEPLVSAVVVLGVCEILSVTNAARQSIESAAVRVL